MEVGVEVEGKWGIEGEERAVNLTPSSIIRSDCNRLTTHVIPYIKVHKSQMYVHQ